MVETIIIVGMHRSGTSCLAGSLEELGLFLGKVFETNPHNLKGNRENASIMELNENILKESQGSWDNPPKKIYWNSNLIDIRDNIIKDFNSRGILQWGFKDPRTLLTLPFWLDGLNKFRFVGTFRNPESVALSLYKRNGMSLKDALTLWKIYNQKLVELHEEYDFPLISFDVSKEEYLSTIIKISEYINIDNKMKNVQLSFFEESLRSSTNSLFDNYQYKDVQILHEKLIKIYENQFKE